MNNYSILLALFILISATSVRSQTIKVGQPIHMSQALIFRELSGIVLDTAEVGIEGLVIQLTTEVDTLTAVTNSKGIFIFKNVKRATFSVAVGGLGYRRFVRKYFLNDEAANLVLDPIILISDNIQLNEVTVNGRPSIVYKTDTTEYRAVDYKVRKNATVDELLKKMEGVQIAKDGSLYYQGQQVVRAKLNGKMFGEGSVTETIQSLPAEIIDKAQFVNDYGDQAARTGIKTGNPTKILNLTTRADKSIANLARNSAGAGTKERYYGRLYLERLNANQQIGVIGNLQQVLNGVAPNSAAAAGTFGADTGTGDSGGHTRIRQGSLNYRDQWSKVIQVNSYYSSRTNNSNGTINSEGKVFSSNGTTSFIKNQDKIGRSGSEQAKFEFELTPDSLNFLRITPGYSSMTSSDKVNLKDQYTGYLNQEIAGHSDQYRTAPTFEILALYQRLFKNSKRNVSVQINISKSSQHDLDETNNLVRYKDVGQAVLRDSLLHFRVDRRNLNKNYRSSLTYVEPFSTVGQLEFNGQLTYRDYNNKASTDSISAVGQVVPISSLANNYQYSFIELRMSINYRYTTEKHSLSLGLVAIPTILKSNQGESATNQKNLNLLPIFRYDHSFSQTEHLSTYYYVNPVEPTFYQLQPFINRSDPQNVLIGNPALKPSFYHAMNLSYDHYVANYRLNLSFNGGYQFVRNKVIYNIAQVRIPSLETYFNELRFENINGTSNWSGNYSISKQLGNGKVVIAVDGSIFYIKDKSMSNNAVYHSDSWSVREKLGLLLNFVEWMEINPDITYDVLRTFFAQPNSVNRDIRTTSLNLENKFFIASWKLGYEVYKNYNQGLPFNRTKNPLLINAYLEKALINGNNGLLRIQVFDLLKENNWINQSVTSYGLTNTRSSVQSRYGYVSFVYTIQQWKGTPKKNGQPRKRRGDGSFIY
jgi:hypothetical protein